MKKKVLIIIAIIIIIVIGIIGYSIFSDLQQESDLITELNEISDLANSEDINMNEINEKLNRTITKGDYAIVEQAFKSYLKDNFDNTLKIADLLNDERITNILTVENYKNDGKEFIKTKEYLTTTKEELENCKTKYVKFFTEEEAMSYINDKGLDSYYTDLYKQEFVGDIESIGHTDEIESSINDVINILNISQQVIEFLSGNKDSWQIEGESIIFVNEELSNQYDEIVNKL